METLTTADTSTMQQLRPRTSGEMGTEGLYELGNPYD